MLAAALACALALTDDAPFWGDLDHGPHAVGFESHWDFDTSRAYSYGGIETARPVLVNVWYPALASDAPAMPHGDYFEIISTDPRLAEFSRALVDYERGVLREYVVGDISDEELDAFLTTPTAARRGAAPAAGRFPVVQYHGGFGSSFEDNSVLCEYLASWGYVVIGSAYPRGDGTSFNIDANDASFRDLDHDTLISQGTIHSDRTADDAARDHEASATATRRNFTALCEYIRIFLDAHLTDDPTADVHRT